MKSHPHRGVATKYAWVFFGVAIVLSVGGLIARRNARQSGPEVGATAADAGVASPSTSARNMPPAASERIPDAPSEPASASARSASVSRREDSAEAERHFARARELLTKSTSERSNAEGVKQSIDEIETAIRLGYPDEAAAYKLLGDAARQMAIGGNRKVPDAAAWEEKARQAYARTVELRPDDSDARLRYSGMLSSPQEQLAQLRLVLAKDPTNSRALFAAGATILEKMRDPNRPIPPELVSEAADYLVRAARLLSARNLTIRGPEIVSMLESNGRTREATEARKIIQERQASEPVTPE